VRGRGGREKERERERERERGREREREREREKEIELLRPGPLVPRKVYFFSCMVTASLDFYSRISHEAKGSLDSRVIVSCLYFLELLVIPSFFLILSSILNFGSGFFREKFSLPPIFRDL
jgi:hypothetical protein